MDSDSIQTLINIIEKRFQTSTIGSLARVEKHLGFVWGHDKEMISIAESDNRNSWLDLREDLLDHGNYQMRATLTDIRKLLVNSLDKGTVQMNYDLSPKTNSTETQENRYE
jgi:hypothetical protein